MEPQFSGWNVSVTSSAHIVVHVDPICSGLVSKGISTVIELEIVSALTYLSHVCICLQS